MKNLFKGSFTILNVFMIFLFIRNLCFKFYGTNFSIFSLLQSRTVDMLFVGTLLLIGVILSIEYIMSFINDIISKKICKINIVFSIIWIYLISKQIIQLLTFTVSFSNMFKVLLGLCLIYFMTLELFTQINNLKNIYNKESLW